MKKAYGIAVIIAIIVAAVIMSSCSPNEHHRGPAPVCVEADLFECTVIRQDSSDIVTGKFSEVRYYCYAKDKFDANRIFSDSLGLDVDPALSSVRNYTIYKIGTLNKPFKVVK